MVLVIHMVMAIAPFAAALVADVIGSSGASLLIALGVYAGAVLLGLLYMQGWYTAVSSWVAAKLAWHLSPRDSAGATLGVFNVVVVGDPSRINGMR